jgi:ethanolamine utilization protein EutA
VSEYVYGRETRAFGDLGVFLGRHAFDQARRWGHKVLDAEEGIRATVIGASQHSVQVSGDTIYIPPTTTLPMHNLRVFAVEIDWTPPIAKLVAQAVKTALLGRDPEVRSEPFALVIATPPFSGYGSVLELASGLSSALGQLSAPDRPRVLVFEQNIAAVVGNALSQLGVLCVDEVLLSEMDFIDIGAGKPDEGYVPIVVKSLVFDV